MRRLPSSLVLPAVLAGIMFVLAVGVTSRGERAPSVPSPPRDISVTMNFLGGPNLIFLCWAQAGHDVNFYDVGIVGFNEGQPRQEVRYGVTTSPCGEALGTGQYMFEPNLYHFAVRACNNAGCSAWADASSGERYWFAIPCADASGNQCARPSELKAGGR